MFNLHSNSPLDTFILYMPPIPFTAAPPQKAEIQHNEHNAENCFSNHAHLILLLPPLVSHPGRWNTLQGRFRWTVKTGVSLSLTVGREYGRRTLTKCKTCHPSLDCHVSCQLPLLKVALLKVLKSITSAKCDVAMTNCKFGVQDKTDCRCWFLFYFITTFVLKIQVCV